MHHGIIIMITKDPLFYMSRVGDDCRKGLMAHPTVKTDEQNKPLNVGGIPCPIPFRIFHLGRSVC